MTQRINPLPAKQAPTKAFNQYNQATFTIGAKANNIINVAVQLQDARGQTPPGICQTDLYLSDNADGSTLTATALTSAFAIGTNGVILANPTAQKVATVISNGTGAFDVNLTQTASPVAYYLVLVMADGSILVGPKIQF